MEEQEYPMTFTIKDGDNNSIECDPDNTALYTFIGKIATHDHLFVIDSERDRSIYCFRQAIGNRIFYHIAEQMVSNGYLAFLNMQYVDDEGEKKYQEFLNGYVHLNTQDINDLPPDWAGK